jgi:hypothetical protein
LTAGVQLEKPVKGIVRGEVQKERGWHRVKGEDSVKREENLKGRNDKLKEYAACTSYRLKLKMNLFVEC